MGSANTKAFKDLLEDSSSPTPPMQRKSIEEVIDPRSPAAEFPRTPIQVEKTPSTLVDPRSPTYGIMRTPIYGESANNQGFFTAAPTDTPVRPLEKPRAIPKEEVVAVLPSPDIDRPRTDSDSSVELMSRSVSNPDLSTDMRSLIRPPVQRKQSTPSKKTPKLLLQANSNCTSARESRDKPSPRSPLSILSEFPSRRQRKSNDTPKAILQRKQASKLHFASKNQTSDIQVYCDKENVTQK
eukprot:GHVO01019538.1.p1 GENE.GHVO01019538.1~~GHVO01019538.1.p1  ORF type:complete len:240 (+),score=27.14 GHVO01019538.1:103-822(+)